MSPAAETMPQTPQDGAFSLARWLDAVAEAGEGERVTVAQMMASTGRRSFAPALLLPGVMMISPLSGVPGLPTTVAVLVLLIVGQLLAGQQQFWLPQWILRRGLARERLRAALERIKPLARWADRVTRPRLACVTDGIGFYVVAVVCGLVALTMPPLELIPFANGLAGAALTAFGLSLVAHDGLVALIAIAFSIAVGAMAWFGLVV